MAVDAGAPRRWQHDTRSLKGGMAHIYRTSELSDCQFTVGARIFRGHRLILAIRSPLFARMLFRDDAANVRLPIRIDITDMPENAFQIMWNFIYTDNIGPMDSQELVIDVYHAATKYDLKGLKEECEKRIQSWDISVSNVISVLQMSDLQFVRNRCWEFLSRNARAVLKSDGILPASSDTLSLLFERGYLSGVPSIELLANVVRWAGKQYSPQKNGEYDYKRVREHLLVPSGATFKGLMGWIGFEKFTPIELGQVISDYPKLLTDEEVRIFFQYSFAPEDKKPALPTW